MNFFPSYPFVSEFQMRIREIPVLDKLQYLYCLLSAVLPVIRQIHYEQCSEIELEKSLRGKTVGRFRGISS